MRPFTVLIGIVMGSAASITFGLFAVLVVFALLAGRHPDLSHELPQLLLSLKSIARVDHVEAGLCRIVIDKEVRLNPAARVTPHLRQVKLAQHPIKIAF